MKGFFCAILTIASSWALSALADGFPNWTFRTPVTFPGYTEETSLSSFPVLLELVEGKGGFSYDRFTHSDGRDLRFSTSGASEELPYEVEHWDKNGTSYIWVQLPILSSDTTILMYQGNPDAVQPAYATNGSVWAEAYAGVWHLNGNAQDSTSNSRHGVAYTGSPLIDFPATTSGVVAGGLHFADNAVGLPSNNTNWIPINDFTLSAWMLFDRPASGIEMVLDWNWTTSGAASNRQGYAVHRLANGHIQFHARTENGIAHGVSSKEVMETGVWYYVTATRSGTNMWLFANDTQMQTSLASGPIDMVSGYDDNRVSMGVRLQNNLAESRRFFEGRLDEVRSMSEARSFIWHQASQLNQSDPGTYVHFLPVMFNIPDAPVLGGPELASVTDTSAVFQIELQTEIGAEVDLLWGLVPGGLDPDSWSHRVPLGSQSEGSLQEALLNLNSNTEYAVAFHAANASGFVTSEPITFRSLQAPADERFRYRMRMDIVGYDSSEILTDFPVLIALHEGLAGFRYSDFRSESGADLRFTLSDGQTLITHEIDQWNPDGVSYVWVGLPALASDTWFYAFWGGGAETLDPEPTIAQETVWVNAFAGVWHLNESLTDSTVFRRDAINGYGPLDASYYEGVTGPVESVPGIFGMGCRFSGSALQFPRNQPQWTPEDDFTLSAWVRFAEPASTIETLLDWGWASSGNAGNRQGYTIRRLENGTLSLVVTTAGGKEHTLNGPSVTDTDWHWVAAVREGTHLVLQVDGVAVNQTIAPDPVEFASDYNDFRVSAGVHLQSNLRETRLYFEGVLDEIRSASSARSTDWLNAEWMNQSAPGSWVSAGAVEYADPGRPSIYAQVGDRTDGNAEILVDLVHAGASSAVVTVFWGEQNGEDDPEHWFESTEPVERGIGDYTQTLSGLLPNRSYFVSVRAENDQGTAWTIPIPFFMPGESVPINLGAISLTNAIKAEGFIERGYPDAQVSIVWGAEDAGPQWSGWPFTAAIGELPALSSLEHDIKGLEPFEKVFFRFVASNEHGVVWSEPATQRALPASTPARTVIFLGNSLTYTYNMPLLTKVFFQSANAPINVRSRAAGGWWLSDHYDNLNPTMFDNADYVFLQEQSQIPLYSSYVQSYMHPSARLLDAEIRSAGARTIFYQTWSNDSREPESSTVRNNYLTIAQELAAANSPVGLAFKYGDITQNPQGYDLEGNPHQYAPGAYLGACVFYGTLTGRSPVGNTYAMNALTETQRIFLQTIAEQAVFENPFGPDGYYWAQDWNDHINDTPTTLDGRVITGYGSYPSPWVRVTTDVGQTQRVYLGSADSQFGLPGEGRLFVSPGGHLRVTDHLQIGRDGKGYLTIEGGHLLVETLVLGGSDAAGGGTLIQTNGTLRAAEVKAELGSNVAILAGGDLFAGEWGESSMPLNLSHQAGRMVPDGEGLTSFHGEWVPGDDAILVVNENQWAFASEIELAGGLEVQLSDLWIPEPDEVLTALIATAISGTFDWFDAPDPVDGWAIVPVYVNNRVELHTVSITLDSDGDGIPDWWEARYAGRSMGLIRDDDLDEDGLSNWQEFIGGSNPVDPTDSSFNLMGIDMESDGQPVIRWPSAEGQFYDLEQTDSLLSPFVPVAVNLIAIPPVNSYPIEELDDESPRFYRISLELVK